MLPKHEGCGWVSHLRHLTITITLLSLILIHLSLFRSPIKILVPGAGLGRLAFEFAKRGYHCQGNEFSYYMLITSNYFLNRVESVNQFELFPFIHQFSNVWEVADQLRAVKIPDIIPQGLPEGSDFSMTAGDFLEVYGGQRGTLVFCFFSLSPFCFFSTQPKVNLPLSFPRYLGLCGDQLFLGYREECGCVH